MTERIGDATPISKLHSHKYDWPNSDGEIWRHVTNYELFDKNTLEYGSLELYRDIHRNMVLRGNLVPSPECATSPILVEIPVTHYSIDYGISLEDVNRGFWLADDDANVWYKLEQSHPRYHSTAIVSLNIFSQYLKFYDAVMYGCKAGNQTNGRSLAKHIRKTHKYSCDKDITAVYRASDGHFDLELAKEKAQFFHSNSTNTFTSDCRLMKSLEKYYRAEKHNHQRSAAHSSSSGGFSRAGDPMSAEGSKKRPAPASSSSRGDAGIGAPPSKKRLLKKEKSVVYEISDDEETTFSDDDLLTAPSAKAGSLKDLIPVKKLKMEHKGGVKDTSKIVSLKKESASSSNPIRMGNATSGVKTWSRDNHVPRGLLDRQPSQQAATVFAAGGGGGSAVVRREPSEPAAEKRTFKSSASSVLDDLGDRFGAHPTQKHKGLKPDWLVHKEKVAREREERTLQMDTLQALGLRNPDPKAKLKSHAVSNPPPLPPPEKSAMHTTTHTTGSQVSGPSFSVSNIPSLTIQPGTAQQQVSPRGGSPRHETHPTHAAPKKASLNQVDQMWNQTYNYPVGGTSGNGASLSLKKKKLKWADQLPDGRLWTVKYIEASYQAGSTNLQGNPSGGREIRWQRLSAEELDDDDDDDEQEKTVVADLDSLKDQEKSVITVGDTSGDSSGTVEERDELKGAGQSDTVSF